jgi:recombination associated protein RdgC
MWFKNLSLFRLQTPTSSDAAALADRLGHARFRPCGTHEMSSRGWVPPLGRKATDLVHEVNGRLLLCLQTEEKLLPSSVVNDVMAGKVAEIEDRESRSVRRKEREGLRESIVFELLPKAFTRTRRAYGYMDPHGGWVVVDSASRQGAEDWTALLRSALGSLPVSPPQVASDPASVMTVWLNDGAAPPGFDLQDECELRDSSEVTAVVRCTGQDLTSEEIHTHLQAGKQVTRLRLSWDNKIAFTLTEELELRRLRFLDIIQEQLSDAKTESDEARMDAEFALMSGELGQLMTRLLEVFGGEAAVRAAAV